MIWIKFGGGFLDHWELAPPIPSPNLCLPKYHGFVDPSSLSSVLISFASKLVLNVRTHLFIFLLLDRRLPKVYRKENGAQGKGSLGPPNRLAPQIWGCVIIVVYSSASEVRGKTLRCAAFILRRQPTPSSSHPAAIFLLSSRHVPRLTELPLST